MRVCTINGCHVGPERVDELHELLQDYAAQVREHEPGCLLVRVLTEAHDPGAVVVYAEFADASAYEAHLQSSHVARLRLRLQPLMGDTHHKTIFQPLA